MTDAQSKMAENNIQKKELICIGCPMGCLLTAVRKEDQTYQISGNTCPRGEVYARNELTNPKRIVTSSVPVTGGILPRVSVKTEEEIPKKDIFRCMEEIKKVKLAAPVNIGDIILTDVAKTGVNVVATKQVEVR